VRKLC